MEMNKQLLVPTIIVAIISILTIIIVLYKNFKFYKNNNIPIFTTKKITIMGMFFALFLLQSFITSFQALDKFIFLSLDSATVVLTAFLFGPIEAFFYALIADTTRILIVQGWIWQLLYALQFPLLGLIAGNIALKYKKTKTTETTEKSSFEAKPYLHFVIIQFIFIALFLFSAIYGYMNKTDLKGIIYSSLVITSFFSIVFYEGIFFFLLKKKNYDQILLLEYLLLIAVFYRIIFGDIYSSLADANLWAPSFKYVFIPRLLKSSYTIPSYIISWFFLINLSSKFIKTNDQNKW